MELFKNAVDGTVANPVDAEKRRLDDMQQKNNPVNDQGDYGDEEAWRAREGDTSGRKYFSGA